jgi:hypothetical protein
MLRAAVHEFAIGTKRTWHRGWLISLSEVKRTYSSLAGHGVLGPARVEKEAEARRQLAS